MPRKMADEEFRAAQWQNRYADHVRPVNELVDALRDTEGLGWLPYVAPWYGGARARVLSVLRNPGPKTHDEGGSGFLCVENDDPTAERQAVMFAEAGNAGADVTRGTHTPGTSTGHPRPPSCRQGLSRLSGWSA